MGSLLILGAGGHSKVVLDAAISTQAFSSYAFLDDRFDSIGNSCTFSGYPVIGCLSHASELLLSKHWDFASVALGNSSLRLKLICQLLDSGFNVPPIIHSSSFVSPSAFIGSGSVVFANSVVQASASIGKGCIVNTLSSVDHDCVLDDGVHVCPGAHLAGEVKVGRLSFIGAGSSIIQGIHIGSDVIVGAGAAVVRNLPNGCTAVGVPALAVST